MDTETINKLKSFQKRFRMPVDCAKNALRLAGIKTENSWMPGWSDESHGAACMLEAFYNALDVSILESPLVDRSMITNRNVSNVMTCLSRYAKDLESVCRHLAKKSDEELTDEHRQIFVGYGALKEILLHWNKEYVLLANAITMELDARLRAIEVQKAQEAAAKLVAEERRFRSLVEQAWPSSNPPAAPAAPQAGATRVSAGLLQKVRNKGSQNETAAA